MYYCLIACSVVDGEWSNWVNGTCSKSCDGGIMNITRECNNPKPSCGGRKCRGLNIRQEKCNDICCPSKIEIFRASHSKLHTNEFHAFCR